MKVRIDGMDTLTFGVGKPAVWGEDTFGMGMFPPFPSAIRGAVRSDWLFRNASWEIAGTPNDPTKDYVISEYALLLNGVPHFPVPADYVWSEEQKKLFRCELQDNDRLSSLTTPAQLWANVEGKLTSAEKRYISRESLQTYLNGGELTASVPLADYITEESKIGIFRERAANTVREKMLYRVPFIRMSGMEENTDNGTVNNAALAANLSGAEPGGLIRFGGENKTAHFTPYDGEISPDITAGQAGDDGRFKLYLATPGIFRSGYQPRLPVAVKLLTAAVYGYSSIGGFDMKEKHPKPMRRAVKAGSVYYFELTENTPENHAVIRALHGQSISDYSAEDGFGICYIGKI